MKSESERLEPDEARKFIEDLCHYMQRKVWRDEDIDATPSDKSSAQKEYFGDTWTFLYGISSGMRLMSAAHNKEFDWENDVEIDHGISGDDRWQEHYDQYGYGPYGEGLEIGKRLAFYEDRNFTFSEEVHESEDENKFEIKSYE